MEMRFTFLGLILAACIGVSLSVLSMKPVSTIHLPYDIVPQQGRTMPMYGLNKGAAEKSAYDAMNMISYTAGKNLLHVVNFTDIFEPKIDRTFRLIAPANDIAECGNLVAFVSRDMTHVTNPGTIHIYQKYPFFENVCNMTVGSNPKSLKFNYRCDIIVVANEGPAAENPQTETFVNPEGTISVVRVNNTYVNPAYTQCPMLRFGSDVRTIDFKVFNNQSIQRDMAGMSIRNPYKGQMDGGQHTFAMNVEPEYVTLNPYAATAFVSLQENNAIAEVFYEEMYAIVHPIGLKNWTNYGIDASAVDSPKGRNRRSINFGKYPVESLLQPDAVEIFDANGELFLLTANEGAPVNMVCESCELETEYVDYEEAQELAGDYLLSEKVPAEVRRAMTNPKQLGQLRISTVDGLETPGSERIDRPVFYGGRGISMFRVSTWGLELVWDSGDQIARGINELYPNAHNHPPFGNPEIVEEVVTPETLINRRWDWFSPHTGAQCQSLAVGSLNATHKVVLVGINGANALGLFTISLYGNYTEPNFESVYRDGEVRAKDRTNYNQLYRSDVQKTQNQFKGIGDIDPDSVVYIPAQMTMGQRPLVMVTSRVSGTITMYQIYEIPRNQLLREQRTALDGATINTPSKVISMLVALLAVAYITFH